MRLLHTTNLAIHEFNHAEEPPPYAALWTTWRDDQKILEHTTNGMLVFTDPVSQTLRNASHAARQSRNLDWLWADVFEGPSLPRVPTMLNYNFPRCAVCIVVVDSKSQTLLPFIPDPWRGFAMGHMQQVPFRFCSETKVAGLGFSDKDYLHSPMSPNASTDAAVVKVSSKPHSSENGITHSRKSEQQVLHSRRCTTADASSQEWVVVSKHDVGAHAHASTREEKRGLKRQAPREWEWELVERPAAKKSAKTTNSRGGSIVSVESGMEQGQEHPLAAAAAGQGVESSGESSGESRSLFDVSCDPDLEPAALDPMHPFAAFKDDLVEHALRKASTAFSTPSSQNEGVESRTEPVDRNRVADHRRYLCPFYAHDKQRYRDCLTSEDLTSILEIKRHLCSRHAKPHYCPICFELFEVPSEWEDHIRRRSCSSRPAVEIQGVDDDQIDKLATVSTTSLSKQDQWRAIFKIVLPRKPLPSQGPWGAVEEAASRLRDFWNREGKRIVAGFVATKFPGLYCEEVAWYGSVPDEERSLGALHREVIADVIGKVIDGLGTEGKEGNRYTTLVESLCAGLLRRGTGLRK